MPYALRLILRPKATIPLETWKSLALPPIRSDIQIVEILHQQGIRQMVGQKVQKFVD